MLNYSTRLGNNKPVPEVIFYGTPGAFDTESWTARGEGGGKDAIKEPVTVPKPAAPAATAAASGNLAPGLQMNDQRVSGEGHVYNWLECVRTRQTPNAPIEVGYAQSVASIMCLQAWESGRRQMYEAAKLEIKAGQSSTLSHNEQADFSARSTPTSSLQRAARLDQSAQRTHDERMVQLAITAGRDARL